MRRNLLARYREKSVGFVQRREDELLLSCARVEPDAVTRARIGTLVQGELDWAYILDMAEYHAILPLLHRNLEIACVEHVPEPALAALRDSDRANAQQNLALTGELLRLIALLEADSIQAIPLKGPTLAMMAYSTLSLRQFGDLDIFIREPDIRRAKEILLGRGYHPDLLLTEREEQLYLRTHYVYEFIRADGGVHVELHYRARPKYFAFELGFEQTHARLTELMLAGRRIRSLSPEDTLLFLCAHGSNHCWERLGWICDVAELIRSQDLDWDAVWWRARELGSERMLLLGVRLAHDLLDAPVPANLLQRSYNDCAVGNLALQTSQGLFDSEQTTSGIVSVAAFHLRARERWRDRLRYCLRVATVTTAEDWALFPLPLSLSFVYSLVRPFRLLGTYGLRSLVRR